MRFYRKARSVTVAAPTNASTVTTRINLWRDHGKNDGTTVSLTQNNPLSRVTPTFEPRRALLFQDLSRRVGQARAFGDIS